MGVVLDIRALLFFNGFTAFVMFICMGHVILRRHTSPGFGLWTWAALANSAGFVFMSFRQVMPDIIAITLADILLVVAGVLIARGLDKFCGRPQVNWLDLTLLLAFTAYMLIFQPGLQARIVTISIALFAVYLRATLLTVGPAARLLGEHNHLLSISVGIISLWCLVRAFATWFFGDQLVHITSAGPYNGMTFLIMIMGNITMMVGLISLNSSRLEKDLTQAMNEIKTLRGIIPICSNCKKIRDDGGYWQQVESYVREHSDAEFTHSICPDCVETLYPELNINNK
jgi:hypothetical protein